METIWELEAPKKWTGVLNFSCPALLDSKRCGTLSKDSHAMPAYAKRSYNQHDFFSHSSHAIACFYFCLVFGQQQHDFCRERVEFIATAFGTATSSSTARSLLTTDKRTTSRLYVEYRAAEDESVSSSDMLSSGRTGNFHPRLDPLLPEPLSLYHMLHGVTKIHRSKNCSKRDGKTN